MKARKTAEEMAQAYLNEIRETNESVARHSVPETIGKAAIVVMNAKSSISDQAIIDQLQYELTRCLNSQATPAIKAMNAQFYQFALDRLLKPAEHAVAND